MTTMPPTTARPLTEPLVQDRDLVARCLAGDAAAQRALYDAHVDRIYRLAYRMTGEADLAEDFTQEAFIRAFERLGQFRGAASLGTWLHAIAASVILNGLRKVKRFRQARELTPELAEAPVSPALPPDLRRRLGDAVDALSDKLRIVFVMHDVEGYKHEEIAGALAIPVGTSKARLFEARAKLRVALAAFAGDHIA